MRERGSISLKKTLAFIITLNKVLTCALEAICKTEEVDSSERKKMIQELLLFFVCA